MNKDRAASELLQSRFHPPRILATRLQPDSPPNMDQLQTVTNNLPLISFESANEDAIPCLSETQSTLSNDVIDIL